MMDLKTYGYIEIEAIQGGLIPGRVTELRRERFTVMTERGEVKAVLKGTFYHMYVQDKTSYLIDKRARNKTKAMWSKQTKKNGGWKK